MNSHKKKVILSVLLVSTMIVSGCSYQKHEEEVADVVMETPEEQESTVTVQSRDIIKTMRFDGQVAPEIQELTFPENGTFQKYKVTMGDKVHKGDILAITEEKELKEKIKELNKQDERQKKEYQSSIKHFDTKIEILNLELKSSDLDDMTKLSKNQELSKQRLLRQQCVDLYQLTSEQLHKTLDDYNDKLGANVIVAPKDGTVVYTKNMDKGYLVSNLSKYIGLADESTQIVSCSAYISEATVNRAKRIYAIRNGKEYDLEYRQMTSAMYNKFKANEMDAHSVFTMTDTDSSLSYSDYMMIIIVTAEAKQALSVPTSVVKTDTVGKFVYLKQNEKKVKTYVQIGVTDDNYIEIKDGLKEGDVIYAGN